MDKNTKEILDLLSECDQKTKMEVITECLSRIVTQDIREKFTDIMEKTNKIAGKR